MRAWIAGAVCLLAASAAHAALPPGFAGIYSDDSSQLGAQAQIGVQTVRQPLEWWRVEPSRGRFDFSYYDSYFADASRAGLQVLPVLISPPAFRSSRPPQSVSRAMYPPKSNAAFANFAAAAVRRYGTSGSFWIEHPELPYVPVRAWQVWNEPSILNFWRSGPNPRRYVALLRAGAHAIRTADPQAEVVAAGLPDSKNLGTPLLQYLAGMYRAGAKGLFDTLAIHPYSPAAVGVVRLAEATRALMNSNGDRAALWVTEFGWSTGGDASAYHVGMRGQANRLAAALSGLVAERRALRLRGFIVFKWKDATPPAGSDSDPWPLHAGLLDADGSPKPAFWAFGRILRSLESGAPAEPGPAELAQISRRNVRLSPLGNAPVLLGCASAQTDACQGTLRLWTAQPERCGAMVSAAGMQLGAIRFRIAVAPALAPVHLSSAAIRLARCAGNLRVRAGVGGHPTAHAASAQSVEFVIRAR